MSGRLAVLALAALALAAAGCTTAAPAPGAKALAAEKPAGWSASAFESWALGNATGSFFRPVGPGGGAGVQHAWPQ